MIWLLISSTGEYEDYSETMHGYFDNEDEALATLNKIREFDYLLRERYKGEYFDEFQRRIYRKFGINAYIDYTGIDWCIKAVDKFYLTKCKG